jgi:glycosyltransferase involved in cell wall biosynthesis
MLEALHSGVPVLAADSGGATDVIEPGRNGWLYRTGDPGDLALRIGELMKTNALQSVAIDQRRMERFSSATVAGQWERVYAGLIGGSSGG